MAVTPMPMPWDEKTGTPEEVAAYGAQKDAYKAENPGAVFQEVGQNKTAADGYAPPAAPAQTNSQSSYAAAPATPAAAPAGPDPFAAMGGGTNVNGNWIPNNNPAEIARQQALAGPAAAAAGAQPVAGGVPPPTQYTATPDMQNVQRDTILAGLARGQQPVTADSQNIKAQLDPFRAEQERTRVQAEAEAAEAASTAGMANSGALNLAKRSAQERAGQQTGLRASELVGRELQSQRDELQQFLSLNAKTIDADQARMLQKQLADLDAQIRREGIASSAALGGQELNLRRDLGQQGINNDIMRMLLQNQQFGNQLGFQIGNAEAGWNRSALLDAMGD